MLVQSRLLATSVQCSAKLPYGHGQRGRVIISFVVVVVVVVVIVFDTNIAIWGDLGIRASNNYHQNIRNDR